MSRMPTKGLSGIMLRHMRLPLGAPRNPLSPVRGGVLDRTSTAWMSSSEFKTDFKFEDRSLLSGPSAADEIWRTGASKAAAVIGCGTVRRQSTEAARPTKRPEQSHSFMAEVVGQQGLGGRGIRLGAGELLKLIDLSAAASAIMHAGHPRTPTLAFDHLDLMVPICHGELVHFDSQVVHVGNSTIVVKVEGKKKDVLTRLWVHTHVAFVTFVSLGQDGKPQMVPELECTTQEELLMRQKVIESQLANKTYKEEQAAIERAGEAWSQEQCKSMLQHVPECLSYDASAIYLRKNFLPRNLNALGTVFGGDLLEWMELGATACASNFTRNPHVITIAMDNIFFHKPILPRHLLELTAKVVYLRKHTMQVECLVKVFEPSWIKEKNPKMKDYDDGYSHVGHFTILNATEYGHKRPITTGLDVSGDKEAQIKYDQADHRFHFYMEQKAEFVQDTQMFDQIQFPRWDKGRRTTTK